MDSLVVDLALNRLSKAVVSALKDLERPNHHSDCKNLSVRFEHLYSLGEITREEYIFLQTRILLNEFCYKMEQKIGNGVMCGFLFYSKKRHKLYYGAGANYPDLIKKALHEQAPIVDMESSEQYRDNDTLIMDSLELWEPEYKELFNQAGAKSFVSQRLRLNDLTFGSFNLLFPYENGSTDEIRQLIGAEIQPIKEQLYHYREEMIEALRAMPQGLILNAKLIKPSIHFSIFPLGFIAMEMFEVFDNLLPYIDIFQ